MTRTCYGPDVVGIGLDPSDLVSEVDLGVRLLDWCCQLLLLKQPLDAVKKVCFSKQHRC